MEINIIAIFDNGLTAKIAEHSSRASFQLGAGLTDDSMSAGYSLQGDYALSSDRGRSSVVMFHYRILEQPRD
jgi:hypothetical protein